MKYETRTEEDGKIVLRLGMTHEAGFPSEPDVDVIVNGVQLLVEAVCGISVFELTRAVIEEYVKNGKAPPGWLVPETEEEPTDEGEAAANDDEPEKPVS